MKSKMFIILSLFVVFSLPIETQKAYACNADTLEAYIKGYKKPYKILYNFCTYCRSAKYNRELDSLVTTHNSDSIAFFTITGEYDQSTVKYLKKNDINSIVYFLKPKKKKRFAIISFDNPVADVSNFILERFCKEATRLGAGGYIILDKNNTPIMWSDYKRDKNDMEYFALADFIQKH